MKDKFHIMKNMLTVHCVLILTKSTILCYSEHSSGETLRPDFTQLQAAAYQHVYGFK